MTSEAVLVFHHLKTNDHRAIKHCKATSLGCAAVDVRSVCKTDCSPAPRWNHQLTECVDAFSCSQDTYRLFAASDAGTATTGIKAEVAQGVVDPGCREVERLQSAQIKRHIDFTIHATDAGHLRHAGLPDDPARNGVIDEPTQVLVGHRWCRNGIGNNRHCVNVKAFHYWFFDATR